MRSIKVVPMFALSLKCVRCGQRARFWAGPKDKLKTKKAVLKMVPSGELNGWRLDGIELCPRCVELSCQSCLIQIRSGWPSLACCCG